MSRSSLARRPATVAPLIFSGWQDVERLRMLLSTAYRAAGVSIVFDPASDPQLRDYLLVGAASAVEHAAVGTVIGGMLGALLGDVRAGMAVGALVGVGAGVARGVATVNDGWRIYASWAPDGTPFAYVRRFESRP